MKESLICILASLILIAPGCKISSENKFYRNNPEPFYMNAYIRLPLGSVKPEGWLLRQLEIQAEGLTGHLDEFWPDLVNSAWQGGDGEAWERGPYYLDGLVPLAYILEDKHLIAKSEKWINKIIESSADSGWFGPPENKDRWPLAVAGKVLMQYYQATGDSRALNVLLKYFRYLHDSPPDWPDKDWRGVRAMENAVTGYWLYRQTGERWLPELMESIGSNSPDWTSYYETFPWDSSALADKKIPVIWDIPGKTAHVVNNAMAIKYPGLWYQQSKDIRFRNAVFSGIEKYDRHHGQACGRFSGDEHLSGKSPDRGTELCAVVEYMYSLGELFEIFGDNSLADRLEYLAYNALPGTTTPDMWAHQYDQQSNQVLVSADERNWSSNGRYSNIYGLMPNFACCLANMHQGWPKFIQNMWMATNDNGLAAAAYGPSRVKAMVGKGTEVEITEVTDYPFHGNVKLTISAGKKTSFPIYFRVPSWSEAVIKWKGRETIGKPGSTVKISHKWQNGDTITIDFPLRISYETRFNNSVTVTRGPLCFALRIDKKYKSSKLDYDNFGYMGSIDWEIFPESAWNYGLMLNREEPEKGMEISENRISSYPFADRGDMIWSQDSAKYYPWDTDPPVVIRTRGIKIPEWTLIDNSAGIPPASPVRISGEPEEIVLVPYGSTRLRITEFPVMDITFMKEMFR